MLELNGAVDFTREYLLDRDPFVAAARALARAASEPKPRRERDRLAAASDGSL